jgi:hypothetical protein
MLFNALLKHDGANDTGLACPGRTDATIHPHPKGKEKVSPGLSRGNVGRGEIRCGRLVR